MRLHTRPTRLCKLRGPGCGSKLIPTPVSLSVDTELRKAIKELPQYFNCDFDNLEPPPQDSRSRVFYWEKIIINLSGQSRLMRLHRPWLSRGYRDRK